MTSESVIVRERRDDDLAALATVLVRVHAVDGYPVEGVADPEAWLHHPRELSSWTADYRGQPIGHIAITAAAPDDDAAQLWRKETGRSVEELLIPIRLFVDPDHRGLGAARHLMASAMQYAKSRGYAVAGDVMAKDRTAIALYERLGARRIGEITHHHSGGLVEPAYVYVY